MTQAAAQPAGQQPAASSLLGPDEAQSAYPGQTRAALEYAAANKYAYGPKYGKLDLVWKLIGAEPRPNDTVRVYLEFRPATFRGKSGAEYIDVSLAGTVTSRRTTRVPAEDAPWVLIALALLSLAGAGALIPLILFYEGGDPLYVAGRTLYVRTGEPRVQPHVIYSAPGTDGIVRNWAVITQGTNTRLAFIKVTLINAQSGSVRVIIDENAAELRTSDDQVLQPVNPLVRAFETDTVDPRNTVQGFLPLWNPVTLNAGEQVEGYLLFEVPAGTTFKEFQWNATDSAIVRFGT
jgi:hypothetical protein